MPKKNITLTMIGAAGIAVPIIGAVMAFIIKVSVIQTELEYLKEENEEQSKKIEKHNDLLIDFLRYNNISSGTGTTGEENP